MITAKMKLTTMNENGEDGASLHFRNLDRQPNGEDTRLNDLTAICPTRDALEASGMQVGDVVTVTIE